MNRTLVESCVREGDRLLVPSLWGEMKIIGEGGGLLVVKQKGRWSQRGMNRYWARGTMLLARLRQVTPDDIVTSAYHLDTFSQGQVLEVLQSGPLSERSAFLAMLT